VSFAVAAVAAVAAIPAIVTASSAAQPTVGSLHFGPRSPLRPSQTPAGLRAAVRRTPGLHGGRLSSRSEQAKLTASDGVAGDFGGWVGGNLRVTAVVGAPFRNGS
jgi:hypothetical protein